MNAAIRRVDVVDEALVRGLADVLIDCVDGGASVGFMAPLERRRAVDFWQRISVDVAAARRALLVAEDHVGVCGTVHLVLEQMENQAHRADLVKMLVHRRARRRGVGAALVRAAEDLAGEQGRTLVVLDTVTGGDAARLYERLGWLRAGDVPRFALYPDGGFCSTTFYYRELG
jgi:GNAT superfamily N-acetyltransferase